MKEYYDSGAVKKEEFLNKEGKIYFQKEYYEDGGVLLEASFTNGIIDGVFKTYYSNGNIEIERIYDLGKKKSYVYYDSLGNKIHWLRSLTKAEIPTYKEEYIKIERLVDSGIVVNIQIPEISPFQIHPVTKEASWKSINIKKGDWLIIPEKDTIEIGIGIELTDSTHAHMTFNQVIVSEISPRYRTIVSCDFN